jgi:hypothetical protein
MARSVERRGMARAPRVAGAGASLVALTSLLCGLLTVSSCATGGTPFQAITEIPPGKALVYLYRPGSFTGGGPAYDVAVGDERIATLAPGGYIPYFARPGHAEFWAHTQAIGVLTAELKSGQVYYLRGGIQSDVGTKRPSFEQVGEGVAMAELAKCKLLASD